MSQETGRWSPLNQRTSVPAVIYGEKKKIKKKKKERQPKENSVGQLSQLEGIY